ncbi:glycoside hydrolase family 3 C-terminal domain-containing protein [Lysobacter sp. S4-A87]|uniref:glycoside hydrolase family 3 protein n=1 Tax=Lysobacter sp. S4-A87 TaxID=2925843 RepID=UPI001F52C389|nr:glycoside hydrolase family 3 N-terminal domain-containing protein [Lysobacter sp. S4-A87]UNK48731.1 glycoside hydrolase family 3 C-terminal domain-containing protein [Lysobacter sp. S4-A87]
MAIGAALYLYGGTSNAADTAPVLQDWPHVDSAIRRDATIEARAARILAGMSLAEKIGQMTQPEIKMITPDEVRTWHIGSVLNGGGSWPAMNKHATVGDWLALADAYHQASMTAAVKNPIPVIWGTDAVHGHNNVVGATLFPHNIGLGAAHDPQLVEKIGHATAQATRATGIDWAFAPTLAVAQNLRWGRSYESFSSDPAVVHAYATSYIRGLQGDLRGDGTVVATAKHFIGDGATDMGRDQGNAIIPRAEMINVHGQGYYGAIGAGVQTVMASFNSWDDVEGGVNYGKMHGTQALLTGALKDKIGFDGFIVSDWNGIAQVPRCSNASCPQAINAGIDMVMVPEDWKAFIANTIKQVEDGTIPMARINDAVTRILRVKLRAGLFDRKPSDGRYAGKADALVHRELARQAVRESLVLLKNERKALPLKRGQRVLVVGKSADSYANQTGGWTLTWQGTDNTSADYLNADTVLAGLREALGPDRVTFDPTGTTAGTGDFDVVVAVIGETPYAETNGDIIGSDSMAHSRRHPEDLAALKAAAAHGKPVVTVFMSGRPLYSNDLINLSDAFVAAWLPGSEGAGVADALVAAKRFEFRGRLSFSWPGVPCPAPENRPDAGKPPLFQRGYGLTYARPASVPRLDEPDVAACGPATSLPVFNTNDAVPFQLQVEAGDSVQAVGASLNDTLSWPTAKPAIRVSTSQINTQQDAKRVTWLAPARLLARSTGANNLNALAFAEGALQFDVVVHKAPTSPVLLGMGSGKVSASIDIAPQLTAAGIGSKVTINVPLRCFGDRKVDIGGVDVPFSVSAQAPFEAAFTRIAVVAGAARQADAIDCGKAK